MNFELYIENLGAIEKAEMTINPLTILAGENGTGKSFVTKFLYSVLNVLMRDVYKMELINVFNEIEKNHKELKDFLSEYLFSEFGMFLVRTRDKVSYTNFSALNLNMSLEIEEADIFLEKLDNIAENLSIKMENDFSEEHKNIFMRVVNKSYDFSQKSEEYFKYRKYIDYLDKNIELLKKIKEVFCLPYPNYIKILNKHIISELKANFQISNLNQLVRYGFERSFFSIIGIINIEIENDDLNSVYNFDSINYILKINRLTFFESPIYWRLSMELIENASRPKNYYLSDKISDERLTGVPKYFLDLRELLFSRFEKGEKEPFIEQCSNDLQKSLNGKFNTESYDLSFETNQGQTISKNLVSFGMTNLGILQAVLNKNIINKGSFVFIDEPESNLHPEWQAVLADILVKLAENGVFVVITTHSSDMLKALDVISQEGNNKENFISVNYFEKGGNLLPLNNNDISPIQQARLKLLETYDEMVLRGYLL